MKYLCISWWNLRISFLLKYICISAFVQELILEISNIQMVCTAQNLLCFWQETNAERHLVKVTVMH